MITKLSNRRGHRKIGVHGSGGATRLSPSIWRLNLFLNWSFMSILTLSLVMLNRGSMKRTLAHSEEREIIIFYENESVEYYLNYVPLCKQFMGLDVYTFHCCWTVLTSMQGTRVLDNTLDSPSSCEKFLFLEIWVMVQFLKGTIVHLPQVCPLLIRLLLGVSVGGQFDMLCDLTVC